MSLQSPLQRIETVASTDMGQRKPVSAYKAYSIRNNLGHLIDEYTQTRINWSRPRGSGAGDAELFTDGGALFWQGGFAHTWLSNARPANLAVQVTFTSDPAVHDDVHWIVSLRSLATSPYDPADIFQWEGDTTSTAFSTDYNIVDDIVVFDGSSVPSRESQTFLSIESGHPAYATIALARLDIRLFSTVIAVEDPGYATFAHHVTRIHLREFP